MTTKRQQIKNDGTEAMVERFMELIESVVRKCCSQFMDTLEEYFREKNRMGPEIRPFPPLLPGEETIVTAEQAQSINKHCVAMHNRIKELEAQLSSQPEE